MCLQMCGVDHQLFRLAVLGCNRREYTIKDTQSAPAYKAVIERLVRPVFPWGITPAKTVANDMDDPGNNALIINTRNPVSLWETGLNTLQLRTGKPE